MDELEKLWNSTGDAHSQIQMCYYDLLDIAKNVAYLHPDLATHLRKIAWSIEDARDTIQGNAAEQVNLSIRNQEQASANLLCAMLEKIS